MSNGLNYKGGEGRGVSRTHTKVLWDSNLHWSTSHCLLIFIILDITKRKIKLVKLERTNKELNCSHHNNFFFFHEKNGGKVCNHSEPSTGPVEVSKNQNGIIPVFYSQFLRTKKKLQCKSEHDQHLITHPTRQDISTGTQGHYADWSPPPERQKTPSWEGSTLLFFHNHFIIVPFCFHQ